MATKLAFKNLKATLFKNHDVWQHKNTWQSESTEASEGEQGTSPQSQSTTDPSLTTNVEASAEQRSLVYLSSFECINFSWDKSSLSKHLELHMSMPQLCAEVETCMTGKVCRATNQEHCFKSAFGTEVLEPHHRYYFQIKCVRGTNFKIGIATELAKQEPNKAFSDTDQGFAFYSTGQLRHASKGLGPDYGEKFQHDDVIGVYVDREEGVLFYSKNGVVFSRNAF